MADARNTRPASVWIAAVAWIPFASGCTFEPAGAVGGPGGPDGGRPIDAAVDPDGALPIDAAMDPDGPLPPAGLHLLLTEVKAQPSASEFIEIWNPLGEAVSLRDYYLTDDKDYERLPEYDRLGTEVPVGNNDAILRFPEGAMLGAGEVAVVALDEQGFAAAFLAAPDYAVRAAVIPVADAMEVVADGSVERSMELTDGGEAIVLFRWNGQSDLVTDVDIVVAGQDPGDPGAENGVPDKTGRAVDGPDDDTDESTYAADGAAMPAITVRSTGSYKRVALEDAAEPDAGGNGVDGHDETSEDTLTTWSQLDTPPTPGVVPPLAGR